MKCFFFVPRITGFLLKTNEKAFKLCTVAIKDYHTKCFEACLMFFSYDFSTRPETMFDMEYLKKISQSLVKPWCYKVKRILYILDRVQSIKADNFCPVIFFHLLVSVSTNILPI